MDNLKNAVLNSQNLLTAHINYWFRYVNDILCSWTGPLPFLHNFLSFINSLYPSIKFTLNSLYPSIKFTLEMGGLKINFLDITISISTYITSITSKFSGKPQLLTSPFMIPPSTLLLINPHPLCQWFTDSSSIPLLPSDFLADVNVIKSLAHTNTISIDDKIIGKNLVSRYLDFSTTLPRSQSSKNWVRLPSWGKLSFQLLHFLKSLGLSSAFYLINTSKNLFSDLKDPIPQTEKSGVYSIWSNWSFPQSRIS